MDIDLKKVATHRSIRGGSGLGDSLYIQPIARKLVIRGDIVEICSWWPDVFIPLVKTGRATVVDFRRGKVDHYAHYVKRKEIEGTDQFTDCCISAGLVPVEMCLDWEVINTDLFNGVRNAARGRPIIAVNMPRRPAGKVKDGDIYWEMEPKWPVYQEVVSRLAKHACVVQIGEGEARFSLHDIEIDLSNRTTVADLIDVASICDGFFSYCSFVVPLAESLSKPGLYLWARRGLESKNKITRWTTPQKVLHRPATSRFLIDDCASEAMETAVDGLLEQAGNQALLRREIGRDRGVRPRSAA